MNDHRKVSVTKFAGKFMCIIFCNIRGIILNHMVLLKTTATGQCYATVLKSDLYTRVKRKRQQLI